VKLLPKFALLSLGVAAVPLAIAGLSSVQVNRQSLREASRAHDELVAVDVANLVAMRFGHLIDVLGAQVRVLTASEGQADLLPGFLNLLYHQSDDFSAVFALDPAGTVQGSVFQQELLAAAAKGHAAIGPAEVARAMASLPISEVLKQGVAAGPVVAAGGAGAHLVLAVRYQPADGRPALAIGALVTLRRLAAELAGLISPGREIFFFDRQGVVIAAAGRSDQASFAGRTLPSTMKAALPPRPQYLATEVGRVLWGGVAGIPALGFGVVMEPPREVALGEERQLGLATIFWIGVSGCAAVLIGGVLARRLSRRVGAMAVGARQIAQGKLDPTFEVGSDDELGELAKALNAMTTSLAAARNEIMRQTEEITAWNETLEKRVADKSQELRETQDLLLRSRSLAAIGSLGAGVAHEINNPLTGILGVAQLLLGDLPDDHPARPLVRDVEDQALRIESIVHNLLRLAQRQAGEEQRPLDLGAIVDDALELCGQKAFRDSGISIDKRIPSPGPPVRGNAAQLQAAVIHLIQNARHAMAGGGTLTLESSLPEAGLLRLKVADTGHGIDPEHLPRIFDPFFTTKARHADTGIGLSVVHKIIEDHGGTIRVESQRGLGTSFSITLPIAGAGALLP
jgi:two-component system NtrC family sensor kinase